MGVRNVIELVCDICGHKEYVTERSKAVESGWRTLDVGTVENWSTKATCPDCTARIGNPPKNIPIDEIPF